MLFGVILNLFQDLLSKNQMLKLVQHDRNLNQTIKVENYVY